MKMPIHIIGLILSVLFISCSGENKDQNNSSRDNQDNSGLLQAEDDLMSGISAAVCYSGYRSGQHPDRGNGAVNPTYDEILEDLHILTDSCDFHLIRLYDCGTNSQMVLQTIKENNLDIKVLQGIWLRAELSNHETCEWLTEPIPEDELKRNKKLNQQEIEKGIQLANQYRDVIIAVNVGNEALVDWNDHKVDTDTVISYVRKVQSSIEQEVTVADNYKWWAENGSKLAKVVDFVSIHVYPVWEGKDINEGLSYSIANIQEVKDSLPGSRIVITEVGWPTTASEFPESANEDNQLKYYKEIMSWSEKMNYTTFFFEAFDEDWKGNPDNMLGAEKHWGLYTVDRKPKKVVQYIYDQ